MTVAGAETAGFDEADEAQFFDAIDRWIERDLKPIVKEFDHADRYPAHVVEQMKELGLFGATIGREYGGLGLPAKTYAQLVMRISSVWMSITGIFNSHSDARARRREVRHASAEERNGCRSSPRARSAAVSR